MRKLRWIAAAGLFVLMGAGIFAYWFDLLPLVEVEGGDYPLAPASALTEYDRLKPYFDEASWTPIWWNASPGSPVMWVAQNTNWKTLPEDEVKAYPKLASSRPLYGAIDFDKVDGKPGGGKTYHLVVDESTGTGKGYDRLYFDANGDLDLTNDPVLTPTAPQGKSTAFQPLTVYFDFGPEYGQRPVQILPRLMEWDQMEKGQVGLWFLMPEARTGKIQIGRHRFNALLCQPHQITIRFDKPATGLYLTTTGFDTHHLWHDWWGEEKLSSFPSAS